MGGTALRLHKNRMKQKEACPMTIAELQGEILRLKQETDTCVLAHSYQAREILEIADVAGDSYALAKAAAGLPQPRALLCGVRFMAEGIKLLAPQKEVRLANPLAGCPMAEQMDKVFIEAVRRQYPAHTIVAYINTTAELKTVCDVCVTSSSAVKIVRALPNNNIVFLPDCNLGDYVARQCPEKNVKLLQGGCPIHAAVNVKEVRAARAAHPGALLLVHPECTPDVTAQADYVGSTAGIMQFARESAAREFLIGTELSIAEHLQYECPDKRFYPLSKKLLCPNMKLTTLMDVYLALRGEGGEMIALDEDTLRDARRCLDKMVELGG
jgi:quinolinate synthase